MPQRLEMILMRSLGISYTDARCLVQNARSDLNTDLPSSAWNEELKTKCEEIHYHNIATQTKHHQVESHSISSSVFKENDIVCNDNETNTSKHIQPEIHEFVAIQKDHIPKTLEDIKLNASVIDDSDDENDDVDSTMLSCEPCYDDLSPPRSLSSKRSPFFSSSQDSLLIKPGDASLLLGELNDDNEKEDTMDDLYDPQHEKSYHTIGSGPPDTDASTGSLKQSSSGKPKLKKKKSKTDVMNKSNRSQSPKSKKVIKKVKSKAKFDDDENVPNDSEKSDIPKYIYIVKCDDIPIHFIMEEAKRKNMGVDGGRPTFSESDLEAIKMMTSLTKSKPSRDATKTKIKKGRSRSVGPKGNPSIANTNEPNACDSTKTKTKKVRSRSAGPKVSRSTANSHESAAKDAVRTQYDMPTSDVADSDKSERRKLCRSCSSGALSKTREDRISSIMQYDEQTEDRTQNDNHVDAVQGTPSKNGIASGRHQLYRSLSQGRRLLNTMHNSFRREKSKIDSNIDDDDDILKNKHNDDDDNGHNANKRTTTNIMLSNHRRSVVV